MPASPLQPPPVTKNAILFGNGLIRTLGSPSSPDLLKETICEPCGQCRESYCPFGGQADYLPFPLIYEYLTLKKQQQHPEKDMHGISAMMRERLRSRLEQFTPQDHPGSILHDLTRLHVDDYLTTNYDTFLSQILEDRDYERKSRQNSETKYSIRRHVQMEKNGHSCRIWNIHGTYNDRPDSLTIQYGYEHYCGCIGKIDSYLKGNYTYQLHKEDITIPLMYKKLHHPQLRKEESWIDLFFFSNVYIMGLNLSSEEMDLLYILNLRSTWLRSSKTQDCIHNRIVFYGQPSHAMKALLEQFNVEVCASSPKPPGKNADTQAYAAYYRRILRDIESRIRRNRLQEA